MIRYLNARRRTIVGMCLSAVLTIGGIVTMENNVSAICDYGGCHVGAGCNELCGFYPDPIGGFWDPTCWAQECWWYICRTLDQPYCWECSNQDYWRCLW
jgi:hypothetical protein